MDQATFIDYGPQAEPDAPEVRADAAAPASDGHRNALEIIEWLASDHCHTLDSAGLISFVALMLTGMGVPIDRLALHLRAPHPTIFGRSIVWGAGDPITVRDIEHGEEVSERIRKSPVLHVMVTREPMLVRIDDPQWTLSEIFRGAGLAELFIAPMIHGAGEAAVSAVTFCTKQRSGFSKADRALFQRILPALRSAVELKVWRITTKNMLDTYIGSDPEQRVLSGRVRRGDIETLDAAIMFCDLHGFTALSNQYPSERVIELLNLYFDQVVPSVTERGGEVLKFMGDGLLALFRSPKGARQSCFTALEAAHLIGQRLATVSVPDIQLEAGIGLHYGGVSYGNIGSRRRLDFTVIGRDVNLASRIQGLCGPTSQPLLLSKRFSELLPPLGTHSIGRHALKGFAEPVELFVPYDASVGRR
jgi:adenylate cyclase